MPKYRVIIEVKTKINVDVVCEDESEAERIALDKSYKEYIESNQQVSAICTYQIE